MIKQDKTSIILLLYSSLEVIFYKYIKKKVIKYLIKKK
jgi:hypothetical protein